MEAKNNVNETVAQVSSKSISYIKAHFENDLSGTPHYVHYWVSRSGIGDAELNVTVSDVGSIIYDADLQIPANEQCSEVKTTTKAYGTDQLFVIGYTPTEDSMYRYEVDPSSIGKP